MCSPGLYHACSSPLELFSLHEEDGHGWLCSPWQMLQVLRREEGGWCQGNPAWDCENSHLQQRAFMLWFRAERFCTALTQSSQTWVGSASHRHRPSFDKVACSGAGDGGGTDRQIAGATQPHQCPAPHLMLGAPQHCFGSMISQQGPCTGWELVASSLPGQCLQPAPCPEPCAPCQPHSSPPAGEHFANLSFLPRAQQHSLLPALQGKALEAPGAPARSPSL